MKRTVSVPSLGALALLCSSVAFAATVTVVPSNASPHVGDPFTVTIHADDMVNVGGATMSMSWNTSAATYISGSLPSSGPLAAATGTILVIHLPTFDLLPGTLSVSGDFDVAVFTFRFEQGNVPMNLVVSDDAGFTTGWFDATTAEAIPVAYVQTHICAPYAIPNSCPAPIVPLPTTVWLLGTALAGLGGRQWMRRKATA